MVRDLNSVLRSFRDDFMSSYPVSITNSCGESYPSLCAVFLKCMHKNIELYQNLNEGLKNIEHKPSGLETFRIITSNRT